MTAEVDYLLSARVGAAAADRFIEDLADGTFQVECLTREEYGQVLALERRYAALAPGLADLSVVVLATRFQTRRLLTFDARHFRVLAPLQGGSFELLPA